MCKVLCERNENNKAVVLTPNLVSNIADVSLVHDSALHCFNPLEVGVRPFEMTPDDIILWNEGDKAEIMDIEGENTFCIKCSSGIHAKGKQMMLLSEFEKQMILQADANNRNTPDTQKSSDKKPSPEQLGKVYNVLRVTVSIIFTKCYFSILSCSLLLLHAFLHPIMKSQVFNNFLVQHSSLFIDLSNLK
jgi:hypothetical protein